MLKKFLLVLLVWVPIPAYSQITCSVNAGVPAWINVKACSLPPHFNGDYGPVFQAAFDYFKNAGNHGGTVYCPVGNYQISSPIVVTGSSLRLFGDTAATLPMAFGSPDTGCTLFATEDLNRNYSGAPLLTFEGSNSSGGQNNEGPVIENVSFRDRSGPNGAGNNLTLVVMHRFNRWTTRNVGFHTANVGLRADSDPGVPPLNSPPGDSSWGYVSQPMCFWSNICLQEPNPWGGMLILGGNLFPRITGIEIAGDQVRVIGAKIDCADPISGLPATTGVDITGNSNVVDGSQFENCNVSIKVRTNGHSYDGYWNRITSNFFFGMHNLSLAATGIKIGDETRNPQPLQTQVIGNNYVIPNGNAVEDGGVGTSEYDQGSPSILGRFLEKVPTDACVPGTLLANTNPYLVNGLATLYVCSSNNTTPTSGSWNPVR